MSDSTPTSLRQRIQALERLVRQLEVQGDSAGATRARAKLSELSGQAGRRRDGSSQKSFPLPGSRVEVTVPPSYQPYEATIHLPSNWADADPQPMQAHKDSGDGPSSFASTAKPDPEHEPNWAVGIQARQPQSLDQLMALLTTPEMAARGRLDAVDGEDNYDSGRPQDPFQDLLRPPSLLPALTIDEAISRVVKTAQLTPEERRAVLKYLYGHPLTPDKVQPFTDHVRSQMRLLYPNMDQYLSSFGSLDPYGNSLFPQRPSGPPPGFADTMKQIQEAAGAKATVKDNQDGTVTWTAGSQTITDTPQAVLGEIKGGVTASGGQGGSQPVRPNLKQDRRDSDPLHLYASFRTKAIAVVDGLNAWLRRHAPGYQSELGEGLRSAPYQHAKYLEGNSPLDGYTKLSGHQYGLAMDIHLRKKGTITWDEPPKGYYAEMHRLTLAQGLKSGQDFGDMAHIEWPRGDKQTYRAAKAWLGFP